MNKTLAVSCLILAGLAGFLGAYFQRQAAPEYAATAVVRPVRDHTDLGDLGANAPSGTAQLVFLQNEADIIRSAVVAQHVAAHLRPGQTTWAEAVSAQAVPDAGTVQITVRAASAAAAVEFANTVAAAYCEYRTARRQRLAQETLVALQPAVTEQERLVQAARDELAAARQALGAEVTAAELRPPAQGTESETLRQLRGQLSQVTMVLLTQTNQLRQLADNPNFPPEELKKLREQVGRVQAQFGELTAAVTQESQRQQALQRYWNAAVELEKEEKVFAPLQMARAVQERDLAAAAASPAEVVAPAATAQMLPARHTSQSMISYAAAAGLLLAGSGVWFGAQSGPPGSCPQP